MPTLRASTRRAALAAFLLFAAALFVVSPAEASRTTTDARPDLSPTSSEALASPSLEPSESSPRFGFGEDLGLLDPEAGPGGFVVFAVGTAQCELTYARNNPITYVDPDGSTVRLAGLSEKQRAALLTQLGSFTGNTYGIDEDGNLQLQSVGEGSSPSATLLINNAIAADFVVSVTPTSGPNQFDSRTNEILLNFASFEGAEYGRVDPRTFNLGSTFVHELFHGASRLLDEVAPGAGWSDRMDWTGPVVDFVNTIRAERCFPLRASYNAEPTMFGPFERLGFNHVDPRHPNRIHFVRRRRVSN